MENSNQRRYYQTENLFLIFNENSYVCKVFIIKLKLQNYTALH